MLDALFAEDSAVMATNTQMIASMPGVLLESMEKGAPVWIEGAMSEVGLPDGYTGNSPQDYADAVRFWTFVLGYDLPYAIHADHTTVKEDTPDAIVAAETLNTAQLEAGYTSFAVDPSSLPAVRGETQLAVLNEMEYKDFFDVAGIGGVTAGKLAKYGTFEKLTGLTKVEGMGEKRIDSLMKYIEARLVLEVLNSATDEELREIPRIDSEILDKLIQHREENGKFNSLDEFDAIIGDNTITIEGIDKPVTLTDYVRTYLDLKRVIEINYDLLKVLPADISKEAEVGHIGKVDPLTGQMKLTTPLEAVVLLESLIERGIEDVQLLAAHNGSKHGVVWKDGKKVPTRVDKERTDELMNAIAPLGAVLAQHGVTGTPFDVLKWMTGLGLIKKANVGTQWRNTALANMPMDLLRSQVKWTIKNKGDKEHQAFFNKLDDMSREEILDDPVLGPFLSSYIKYSIRPYRYEIADMRPAYLRQVIEETRNTAAKFFKAFNAEGKIWLITDHLGWYWLPNSPE